MEEKARGRRGCSGPPTSTGQMLSDSAQHTTFAFNHNLVLSSFCSILSLLFYGHQLQLNS